MLLPADSVQEEGFLLLMAVLPASYVVQDDSTRTWKAQMLKAAETAA